MLAAPVAELPAADSCPGGCRYEMKLDGWRLISFGDYKGHVYLQSRIGKPLTTYFPEIARVVREYLPRDVVVDGELVVLDPDGTRTSFVLLQRRIVAGVRPLQLARETPAHYVVFDLLQEGGRELLSWPLSDRRARLAELVADAPPQLTLCPQTGDADVADDWRTDWAAAGTIEGLVIKGARSRYTPGSRRGWRKYRVHESTDAIVGGVTGSRSRPESVLVGRFDPDGRLRYLGRTNTLTAH